MKELGSENSFFGLFFNLLLFLVFYLSEFFQAVRVDFELLGLDKIINLLVVLLQDELLQLLLSFEHFFGF